MQKLAGISKDMLSRSPSDTKISAAQAHLGSPANWDQQKGPPLIRKWIPPERTNVGDMRV